jgi:hypothetical protein
MSGKTTDELKFEEYRQQLREEAVRLACYVRVYRRLHERRQDRLAEMNLAPAFFQTVTDALFSAIVLWVDKLCDERSERGLHNFLTFVEHHQDILSIDALKRRRSYPDGHWMLNREKIDLRAIQEDRERIRTFAPLQSFRLRRDKFHAHFDKEYFFDRGRLGDDAPLSWNDLEETVALMKDVLDRYSTAYDGDIFVLEPMNASDLDHLLEELHRARVDGESH